MRSLAKLFWVLVLGGVVFYGVVAVTDPWAFHIGGSWTPLLTWKGSGMLHMKSGAEYPLYISFYPSSHSSQLRLDGLRPTGGLQGSGWLCTSRGVALPMTLSGTIYGGWRSTEGSLMSFRLLERQIVNVGQGRGFFDLFGRWRGPQLVMDDRAHVPEPFRSGLKIERASVTFDQDTYSGFKAACANVPNYAHR